MGGGRLGELGDPNWGLLGNWGAREYSVILLGGGGGGEVGARRPTAGGRRETGGSGNIR